MNVHDEPWSCEQVRERLEPFLDGDLEAGDVERVRAHLGDAGGCAGCRRELALAELIRDSLRGLPRLACPDSVVERVLARGADDVVPLADAATARRAPPSPANDEANDEEPARGGWWRPAVLAVAAALLLVLGLVAFRSLMPLMNAGPAPADLLVEIDEGAAAAVDAEDLARATEEARWALAYVASIGRHSAITLRDDVVGRDIVRPSALALQRALDPLWPELDPADRASVRPGEKP